MSTFSATALVRVTIEVDAGSSWGPDCTVGQIRDQAGREAVARIQNALAAAKTPCAIVGRPAVVSVMHGETQDMRR